MAYIEAEMKKSLKEFVSMSGRWDMEGLKVKFAELLHDNAGMAMWGTKTKHLINISKTVLNKQIYKYKLI